VPFAPHILRISSVIRKWGYEKSGRIGDGKSASLRQIGRSLLGRSSGVKPISIWFFEPRLHMHCQSAGNRQQVGSTHVLPTFIRVSSPHYSFIDGPVRCRN